MTELDILKKIYLQSEEDVINEIARLRSRGLIDYHAVAALKRIQAILSKMVGRSGGYVRRMVEKYFYKKHPEAYTRAPKTAAEHLAGYINAESITMEQADIIQRLTNSVEFKLAEAANNVTDGLTGVLLGRQAQDLFRSAGLDMVLRQQTQGTRLALERDFVEQLQRQGVTCFTDKAGRKWSLHNYADMVTRTTSRQAETLALITRDPEQDLYKMSSHYGACKLCAPYQGRVYSKSGTSPYYPPLASAFGKIDPSGPNTLANSYLNIHPNCLHSLTPWGEWMVSEEELKKVRKFSSPTTNPFDRDPRSEAEIAAYRRKEEGRRKWLEAFKQWEKYRDAGIGPKSFDTFLKHKMADDEKYKAWLEAHKNLGI